MEISFTHNPASLIKDKVHDVTAAPILATRLRSGSVIKFTLGTRFVGDLEANRKTNVSPEQTIVSLRDSALPNPLLLPPPKGAR